MKKTIAVLFMVAMLIFLQLSPPQAKNEKIVIGHRGACGYLPEHTLESYALAFVLGADYVEFDLVMTKDGELICLHDIYLENTTNVEEVFPERARGDGKWYAADFTLWEIKQLRVHERTQENGKAYYPNRFPLDYEIFEIPTLSEAIGLIKGLNKSMKREVGIYIELKEPDWHREQKLPMEETLLRVLKKNGYDSGDAGVFIQCFEVDSLMRLRFNIKTKFLLIQLVGEEDYGMLDENGLDRIATYADGIGPNKLLIEKDPGVVDRAHRQKLMVHPWTFRSDDLPGQYQTPEEELFQFLYIYDVDGIFTEFPDLAVRIRDLELEGDN